LIFILWEVRIWEDPQFGKCRSCRACLRGPESPRRAATITPAGSTGQYLVEPVPRYFRPLDLDRESATDSLSKTGDSGKADALADRMRRTMLNLPNRASIRFGDREAFLVFARMGRMRAAYRNFRRANRAFLTKGEFSHVDSQNGALMFCRHARMFETRLAAMSANPLSRWTQLARFARCSGNTHEID
jgi:hypothetical protein